MPFCWPSTTKWWRWTALGQVPEQPALVDEQFYGSRVVRDLAAFKQEADVIVANRHTADLEDLKAKVYTRDLFGQD